MKNLILPWYIKIICGTYGKKCKIESKIEKCNDSTKRYDRNGCNVSIKKNRMVIRIIYKYYVQYNKNTSRKYKNVKKQSAKIIL